MREWKLESHRDSEWLLRSDTSRHHQLNQRRWRPGGPVAEPNLIITFDANSGQSASGPALGVAVALPGNSPQAGTFDSTNSVAAESSLTLVASAGALQVGWTQFFNTGNLEATVGTFSLTLNAAGTLGGASSDHPNRTEWLNPHGTLTATMPPRLAEGQAMAQGTVTVNITF